MAREGLQPVTLTADAFPVQCLQRDFSALGNSRSKPSRWLQAGCTVSPLSEADAAWFYQLFTCFEAKMEVLASGNGAGRMQCSLSAKGLKEGWVW